MTYRCWLNAPILTLAMAGLASVGTGLARGFQEPSAQNAAGPVVLPLAQALQNTQKTGKPTVAVSSAFLGELLKSPSARVLAASAVFAPIPEDASADRTRWLGPSESREVRVYRRGAERAELVGHLNDGEDAPHAVAWLKTLRRPAGEAIKTDEGVSRANHWHHQAAVPSPQAAVPPAPPAMAPPSPPAYLPPMAPPTQTLVPLAVTPNPAAAVVAQPAAAPVVLQTPAPSILLQQTAPTIYIAPPAQPANIQILTPPPVAPSVSVLQPATAVQAPQLFLAPTAAVAPPVAPAVVAPAPAAMAVPAYATAPAYAAAPTAVPAYMTAAAPATTTVTAVQPGLLGQMIGTLGERMAKHKQPRLKVTTTQTTAPALVPAAAPMAVQPTAAMAPQYHYIPSAAPQAVAPPVAPPVQPSGQQ
jgi:hypothetical protein